LAEVLAPVVLWLDEVDKAFSGMAGGDNGISARVFGYFLTWLAEKQDTIFVVATANDFRALLARFPEFGRKGRFDEIFWVGLPDAEARQQIFAIYLKRLQSEGYLTVNDDQVRQLLVDLRIAGAPADGDAFNRLCWLLSQNQVSNNMTGAEIEHAINEALFEVFRLARLPGNQQTFTPQVVVKTVQGAMLRALYRPGSPDHVLLQQLELDARAKNWAMAG
jgi:SpoVK/Ycf46/Vps4 family AAA+-type ATPase